VPDAALDETVPNTPGRDTLDETVPPLSGPGSLSDLSSLAGLLRIIAATPEISVAPRELPPGAFAGGAFEIERKLGFGGMGVVYLARDPQLDRRVAIKLPRAHGGLDEINRMRREAAAMARLSHPNVVQVYEVDTTGGELFIVMEYMGGGTLRGWLDEDHDTATILDMFTAVGEGLAAAHNAGIAHRDFKPDNVFIAEDGRPCVADFGLARGIGAGDAAPIEETDANSSGSLDLRLTATGATLGIPRYMAPEQFEGGPVDARADQFAFCVALYEELHGQHPFGGDSLIDLRERVCAGVVLPPKPDRPVPKRLRDLLSRGLRVEPDERFLDMRALLDALAALRHGWRSPRVYVAGAVALVAVVAGVFWLTRPAVQSAVCTGATTRMAGVWDGPARAEAEAGFRASGIADAAAIWDAVAPRLDRYRDRWEENYREACRATRVRRERSEAALDATMGCLEQGRGQLAQLAHLFGHADRQIAARAGAAVDSLGDPAACQHPSEHIDATKTLSETARAEIKELRKQTGRLRALSSTAQYEQASALAADLVKRARAAQFPPVLAEALYNWGLMGRYREGFSKDAVARLEEAFNVAYAAGYDHMVANSAAELTLLAGTRNHVEDARRWFRMGLAAIKRMKGNVGIESSLHCGYVTAMLRANDTKEAIHQGELCLKQSIQAFGPDGRAAGIGHNNLGMAQIEAGHYRLAEKTLEAGAAIYAKHPHQYRSQAANTLVDLGIARFRLGKMARAEDDFRRAFAIYAKLPPQHNLALATAHSNFASVLVQRGKPGEALAHQEASLAITRERLQGPSPSLARNLGNLAIANVSNGKLGRAVKLARESLKMFEKLYPKDDHVDLVNAHTMYGTLLRYEHDSAASLVELERAVALSSKLYPPHHPQKVNPLIELGHTLAALGKQPRAIATLGHAVELSKAADVPPPWRAEAMFALAQSLHAVHRQPQRRRTLARQARAIYHKLGKGFGHQVSEIDAWLRRPR